MLKFIAGFVLGIVVAQVGVSGVVKPLEQGVQYIKDASKSLEDHAEKAVDKRP